MNPKRFLLPALMASPLLLALAPLADGLNFNPAKGSSLSKNTEINMSFELGDMTVVVDGQDMSGQIPADASGNMDMTMGWTDKYVDLKDGKPLELIRTYDEMSGSMEMNGGGESDSNDIPDFDALSGKTIRFTWNEEKKEYDVAFHECEGEEKLLKTQQIDMDYRMMLPTAEVAVGDKWEVPTDFVRQILDGIKNGDMGEDGAAMQAILQDELFPQLERMLENFKTSCEYKGRRDEDGVDAGVIAVSIEGKGDLDLKSMIESLVEEQMKNMGQEIEFSIGKATLAMNMKGKGEVLWDIKSGHVLSADQTADFTINVGFDASIDAGGQSHSVEAEIEVPGKFSQTMTLKK